MRIKINYQINESYIMKKNRDKLFWKQNDRYINHKELLRSYVELENKLKASEEKLKINDSEIILAKPL